METYTGPSTEERIFDAGKYLKSVEADGKVYRIARPGPDFYTEGTDGEIHLMPQPTNEVRKKIRNAELAELDRNA